MQENKIEVDVSDRKCYNCKKIFRNPAELQRHKNRKTPCLIRDIAPDQVANPNRCIFCNKVFVQHQSLTRHLKICKIKNGGMDILDEKVRYEQELRMMKERDIQKDEKMKEIQAQVSAMQAEINELKARPATVTNNTVNITNNNTVNVNFLSYLAPRTDHINLKQEDLLVDSTICKMIELIYFNENAQENHTIYLPNLKDDRILAFDNGSWNHLVGDAIKEAFNRVRDNAYLTGIDKINNGSLYANDEEYGKLYPVVRNAIQSFNTNGDHARCTDEDIMEIITKKRELVAKTIRDNKVQLKI